MPSGGEGVVGGEGMGVGLAESDVERVSNQFHGR